MLSNLNNILQTNKYTHTAPLGYMQLLGCEIKLMKEVVM